MNNYGFGAVDGRDIAIRELEDRGAAYKHRITALEAQVRRLQRYGYVWEDNFREQMQGQHGDFVEATIQQLRDECLHPGDLDLMRGSNNELAGEATDGDR